MAKCSERFLSTYFTDGAPPVAGNVRRELELADTLERLSRAGLADFYQGDVGQQIAVDCEDIGSPVTMDDLRSFKAIFRDPLTLRVPGASLYNLPPPTPGIVSLAILALFSRLNVRKADSFEHIHGLVEAAKHGARIREAVVADHGPDPRTPEKYLNSAWLDKTASTISMEHAAAYPMPPDKGDTSWLGAADEQGFVVSYIQSVAAGYGAHCVLPKTGILMQNRGSSLSLDPSNHNALQPGRLPPHTLNAAIAVRDNGDIACYGSMGGQGQPQFQAQIFSRWAMLGQSMADAVDAPRFLLGRTFLAPTTSLKLESRFDDDLVARLRSLGNVVEHRSEPYLDEFGHAGMVARKASGIIEACHDPRADGNSAGW